MVTFGAGAALMYFLDPIRGARRRGLIRQKSVHYLHRSGGLVDKAARDAMNRGRGMLASTRSTLLPHFGSHRVSDEILVDRVRAKLGRYVSHPHAIHVVSSDGKIRIEGQILAHEVAPLLHAIARIDGVSTIENRLESHKRANRLPSLQGGIQRPGEKPDFLQSNWAPATRILLAGLGAAVAISGIRRRDALGAPVALFGLGTFLRAATNTEIGRLLGIRGGRSALTVREIVNIAAPIERVYGFFEKPENFPRFLTDVREVRSRGGERFHWIVSGPGGIPLSWESELTRKVPNEVVAWRSIGGSVIPNAGRVRFRRNERGGTRVELEFSFRPPAGVLGAFAAKLFGSDPKHKLGEALGQMKTLIEQGPSERQRRRGIAMPRIQSGT